MVDDSNEIAIDPNLAGLLANGLIAPPLATSIRERLRTRVLERAAGIHVVRADAGVWSPILPGVSIKRLRADPVAGTETNLWRLAAGAAIPEHDHHDDEECLVLEGSIVQEGIEYHAGDYLHATPGSRHVTLRAPHGALLLIRSQTLNKYLAARGG